MIKKAIDTIKNIVTDIEVGMKFKAKIVRILEFGAFAELAPNKEGMIHISKISDKRVAKVEDVLKVGDEVDVKVIKIDTFKNRIDLSMKASDLQA